ncbi:hypothetical protein AArcSl_1978 [Halalkaliarchaeum desulfuricum]|uniref:Uncharacterized protein n=1 Tax=Halalkaliarchaeum desulfuricum TaxID=2055893 RepID=A0A343TKI1_9EURY|nr:hypothetical protein AArcSl_1978 [Halalkaliarchaeum desulfuricum]
MTAGTTFGSAANTPIDGHPLPAFGAFRTPSGTPRDSHRGVRNRKLGDRPGDRVSPVPLLSRMSPGAGGCK